MRITGGVLALIAGIFGFIAAIVTLFFGGVGAAFSAHGSDAVLRFGWGGIAFSFLVLIYGACVLGSKERWAGYLVVVSAIGGWFLGGLFVGICMVLALIGGVLSLVQRRPNLDHAKPSRIAAAVAILPLLVVVALSVESVSEARSSVDSSAAEVAPSSSVPSPAESATVASESEGGVSCKSIPATLWHSIQGASAISRGVTGCDDVTIVSKGDLDGDGKSDVVAAWTAQSSCIDFPDEAPGSCGNNVAQFVSAQLGNGTSIPPVRLHGEATAARVSREGLDVDVLRFGPDDPHCCPSVKAIEHLVLDGGKLTSPNDPSKEAASEQATSADSATAKKCGLIADTAYQAAQIRLDGYTTNEEKMMRLMQGGANANLAGALLSFATLRPTDSPDLLKQVVLDHCLKGDVEAIDHDPRLHPTAH